MFCFTCPLKRTAFAAMLLGLLACQSGFSAVDTDRWSERETHLANEYLGLLVSQPDYGRVVDLLWALYDKHGASQLLIENVVTQARATNHPALLMVLGHLYRKGGFVDQAKAVYDEVLRVEPKNARALQSRADLASQSGDSQTAYEIISKLVAYTPEADPQKVSMLMQLGSLAVALAQNEAAVSAWERAVKLRPGDFNLVRQVAELILRIGLPDRAAVFYMSLAEQTDPQQRLDALYDLARIHEHADQFVKADAALVKGLGLLDFRDDRYMDFFKRRVRLHERFGRLDEMRQQLTTAADARPISERALRDWASFTKITVDTEALVLALRELVQKVPFADEYRYDLVRVLLDHDGAIEAAVLLDERLKGGGIDLPALIFLRAEADLRQGKTPEAIARIQELVKLPEISLEVEKQALIFAQQRALDAVIELILKGRLEREPAKAETVFELAAFYKARKDMAAADALLRRFTQAAVSDGDRQRRLNDAAAFLASGSDLDSAILLAREAASKVSAGREEFLRLADILIEHDDAEESLTWMEKAWQSSLTDEDGADVDERIYSLLLGDDKQKARKSKGSGVEFQLPDAFTGKGFASNDEAPEAAVIPEAVMAKMRTLAATKVTMSKLSTRELFRSAWWSVRSEQWDQAYAALAALQKDAQNKPRELSLEAERLLLELAMLDKNTALAIRVLRRLIQRDESGRIRYSLRFSELLLEDEQVANAAVSIGLSAERTGWRLSGAAPMPAIAATSFLERAYSETPDSEQLLQALTQCYALQRRNDDARKLWESAISRATGASAVTLMERHAERLLQKMDLAEYVQVQCRIIEVETDVKRRREAFKRFLDRLLWSEQGGELTETALKDRLKLVNDTLFTQVKRHPFDGFYQEALAQVYSRSGDSVKAFAAMKQAYYTSPDTPFSLDQLREAALKVADMKSAIYFQKQIAAAAAPQELAMESRRLVEMLEETFQMAEADRVRRRLESRFSQDAAALEALAEHYRSTGQDEAERRVYEQIARVRPWDPRLQLRLALKCLRLADEVSAMRHLQEICSRTEIQAFHGGNIAAERMPLPLLEIRKPTAAGTAAVITDLLDSATSLSNDEAKTLRQFFGMPRAEFVELPDSAPLIRLRAIEELGKLASRGDPLGRSSLPMMELKSPVEKLWSLYYRREWDVFRKELRQLMSQGTGLESQFCQLWLTLRASGMADALQWCEQKGLAVEIQESRKRVLLAVGAMLADLEGFRFEKGELAILGSLRCTAVMDIIRRLQDSQRYPEALELGESVRRHQPELSDIFTFSLARIAESAERWDLARGYLSRVVRGPVRPEAYRGTYDPFLFSLSAATRLAVTPEEREKNLRTAWRHLQATPDSAMTSLRKSAVAGLAGSSETAAAEMSGFMINDFLHARQMGEIRGMLMPQGSLRYEEPMHLRSLWEETREIQARFVQEGMGPLVQKVNEGLTAKWGSVALTSRSGLEFGEWRLGNLIGKMRQVDYPTRLRLLREHLASVDMRLEVSVDTLSELGGRLENAGMAREAIEVYGLLPVRAPANPEYAQCLIRVSEAGLDTKMGLKFTLQLLNAEPPMKPPQPGDEVLREKHAHFLSLDFNVAELHKLAYQTQVTRLLQGRIPDAVPYLRELALLHERLGQRALATAAWERLHEAFAVNAGSGIVPDAESCVHRARLLIEQSKPAQALDVLRLIPLGEKSGSMGREMLKMRATLLAQNQGWEEIHQLMTLAVELKSLDCISHISELCRLHGRTSEALNFITQAERSLKEDGDRFRLRLELLKLMAHDLAWTPERGRSQVAALFRVRQRDRESLQQVLGWFGNQAKGRNGKAWMTLLRSEVRAGVDRPLAALLLSAFAEDAPDGMKDDLSYGWQAVKEGDRVCLELAAETLMACHRPAWAWQACLGLQDLPSLRLEARKIPLMLRVANALGDRVIVQEIFSEVVRMPFPGGTQTVAWATALEESDQPELARELYLAALDRLEDTHGMQPELSSAWARHLIRRQEFAAAESYLMKNLWMSPNESAALLHELYFGWHRLADMKSELHKFHLPGGIEKEALFLATKSLGLPLPMMPVSP